MNSNFDISEEMDWASNLLEVLGEKYPEQAKKLVQTQTKKCANSYRNKIPKKGTKKRKGGTGNLRKGVGQNTKNFKGRYVGMVYNTAPHAHLYEDGHIAVNGKKVPGRHPLYNTMILEAPQIDSEIDSFIDEVFGEI